MAGVAVLVGVGDFVGVGVFVGVVVGGEKVEEELLDVFLEAVVNKAHSGAPSDFLPPDCP